MENIVYNITALSRKEQPWLEPYDSTERLNYYMFENNPRLKFNFMEFPEKPNELMPLKNNTADILLFATPPFLNYMAQYNVGITIPFMFSYNVILSRKNSTGTAATPGPFNEMLNVSCEIWILMLIMLFVLTVIDVIEERLNNFKRNLASSFADKLFHHYQAIVGQDIKMPSLPAVQISNGIWFLELLVFMNLFAGLMRAKYTAHPTYNINSIEDLLKATNVETRVNIQSLKEVCLSIEKEMINLCERSAQQRKKDKITKKDTVTELGKGTRALFGEFTQLTLGMEIFVKNDSLKNVFKNNFHMSYKRYHTKSIIFFVGKHIPNEALKLINNRLRTFFETSQFVVWQRGIEGRIGLKLEPSPYSPTLTTCQPIRAVDVKAVFTLCAVILCFAPILSVIEIYQFLKI